MSPWGVYVHVPWCRIRCPYCAFHVRVDRDVDWTGFVDRALSEAALRWPDFPGEPHTVYLGGGTPSRMPAEELARLVEGLRSPTTVETTLEFNPEDLTAERLGAAIASGVDRVSLGVQTLSVSHARHLGRTHTPAEARQAMHLLQRAPLRSWSADLMFGLHDQTLPDLRQDLEYLLAFTPPHVSLYGLTVEQGTPYARAAERGAISPAEDELWRSMYGHLVGRMSDAGLDRYEVSNFARPGHRSEHNRGYWSCRPYMGLGPAAHGLAPDGTRWVNVSTEAWMRGEGPTASTELPDGEARATDILVAGLRGVDGIDLEALAASTGWSPDEAALQRLCEAGLVKRQGTWTKLAPEGFYVADGVVRTLVRALEPA